MFVLRKTMDEAVERERAHYRHLSSLFGHALHQTAALQKQLGDWITDKGDTLTPEQFAALFYSHNDKWQAEFFNAMQDVVKAAYEALPPKSLNEFRMGPGVPYGEAQWCWMADHLNESGFETLTAMFEHANYAATRKTEQASA